MGTINRKKAHAIRENNFPEGVRFCLLIGDLQFHTAVDDIALQPVQADDLLVAATVTEILLGDCPERSSV